MMQEQQQQLPTKVCASPPFPRRTTSCATSTTERTTSSQTNFSSSCSNGYDCDDDGDDDEERVVGNNNNVPRPSSQQIVQGLCIEDKLALLSGHSLWQLPGTRDFKQQYPSIEHAIPNQYVCDGPHGVRRPLTLMGLKESYKATCFPTASSLACSWNVDLLSKVVGPTLSDESYQLGVSVLLGPGMNLKRHPAGGRNFEYFSEDPLLSGRLAAALVNGIQYDGKTGACLKHFAINNQESHRFVVDAVVDERTARELYYKNFQIAIEESNPATIMCSYNKINGVFASENTYLVSDVLRNEWGYQGVVMTDWGATNIRSCGITAGIDLEMPGSCGCHTREIMNSLRAGTLLESSIDDCCVRMLDLIQKYKGASSQNPVDAEIDYDRHHELARDAAMECVVLLHNNNNLLPLSKGTSIALIGDFAKGSPRFQGMGSSQVTCSREPATLFHELRRHTDKIFYAKGYLADDTVGTGNDDDDDDEDDSDESEDSPDTEMITQSLIDEAVQLVQQQQPDVVLLSIGLPEIMESEGFDRTSLELPEHHIQLVETVCQVHSKEVVLLLSNGGAIQLAEGCLKAGAILEGYLGGQAGAAAMADLVFGVQSPSGKLAETMPLQMKDHVADAYFPGTRHTVEHREGLDVGYRYFDTCQRDVRYPFGHGLSYTTFEYCNLEVDLVKDEERVKKVAVKFDVKNTGTIAGSEVAQCYVRDMEASVYRPTHELKDFCKVPLNVGESTSITFNLDFDAFAFYDIGYEEWVVESGQFEIQIGSSSHDIRLSSIVEITTGREASQLAKESYPPCKEGVKMHTTVVDDETFANRFGLESPKAGMSTTFVVSPFDRNSLLKEVAVTSWIGRFLRYIVFRESLKEVQSGASEKRQKRMMKENVDNLPLRALVLFSKGSLSFDTLDALIAAMNGSFFLSLGFAATAAGGLLVTLVSSIISMLAITNGNGRNDSIHTAEEVEELV